MHEYKERNGVAVKVTEAREINRLQKSLKDGRGWARETLGTKCWRVVSAGATGRRVARKDGTNFPTLKVEEDGEGSFGSELRNMPTFSSG